MTVVLLSRIKLAIRSAFLVATTMNSELECEGSQWRKLPYLGVHLPVYCFDRPARVVSIRRDTDWAVSMRQGVEWTVSIRWVSVAQGIDSPVLVRLFRFANFDLLEDRFDRIDSSGSVATTVCLLFAACSLLLAPCSLLPAACYLLPAASCSRTG